MRFSARRDLQISLVNWLRRHRSPLFLVCVSLCVSLPPPPLVVCRGRIARSCRWLWRHVIRQLSSTCCPMRQGRVVSTACRRLRFLRVDSALVRKVTCAVGATWSLGLSHAPVPGVLIPNVVHVVRVFAVEKMWSMARGRHLWCGLGFPSLCQAHGSQVALSE